MIPDQERLAQRLEALLAEADAVLVKVRRLVDMLPARGEDPGRPPAWRAVVQRREDQGG